MRLFTPILILIFHLPLLPLDNTLLCFFYFYFQYLFETKRNGMAKAQAKTIINLWRARNKNVLTIISQSEKESCQKPWTLDYKCARLQWQDKSKYAAKSLHVRCFWSDPDENLFSISILPLSRKCMEITIFFEFICFDLRKRITTVG